MYNKESIIKINVAKLKNICDNTDINANSYMFLVKILPSLNTKYNKITIDGHYPTIKKLSEILNIDKFLINEILDELEENDIIKTIKDYSKYDGIYINPYLLSFSNKISQYTKNLFKETFIDNELGFVYIINMEDTNLYKIGYTSNKNINERIMVLQTGCPNKLKLIDFFSGSRKLEKYLHELYKTLQVKNEWFEIDDYSIIESIKNSTFKIG